MYMKQICAFSTILTAKVSRVSTKVKVKLWKINKETLHSINKEILHSYTCISGAVLWILSEA